MDKKDLLLYFNFINLSNKIILDFCENLDLENFFDLDRKIFDNLSKINKEKIFSSKNLEDFKAYREKVFKASYKICTIYDENYPINLSFIEDRPALFYYKEIWKKKMKMP